MKRFLSLLFFILLVVSLTACSRQTGPVETPASAQTDAQNTPTEAPTPGPSPTPEPKPYAPMDIFSDEFNPFGMDSPFTVFAAEFNKGSAKLGNNQFVLSMTGSGNMYACVAYLADVAGLGLDDGGKMELLEEYRANGYFCEFTSKEGQIVTIRQANPEDDRYEYVEADGSHDFVGGGCVIDITFFINDADVEKYTKLVIDNYNLNALTPIADYFDVKTDFSECGIGVNLHKNEVRAYAIYSIPDVDTVQKSIEENVQGGWWEWNGMMQTVMQYGPIDSKLTFDGKGGGIMIEQVNPDLNAAASEYAEAEVSLAKFGFGFDPEGICGVYEQHEPYYMNVAIHRPEWGEYSEDWNIEYYDTAVNGYVLRITYHAIEGKYRITLNKGDSGGVFNYFPVTGEYVDEYPDPDTIRQAFNAAFGTQGEDFRAKPMARFEQVVQEHFGMSIDELYALPIY